MRRRRSSSRTSSSPSSTAARLVRGDVGEELAKLQQEFDGEIEVGGPTLAAQFIERGLVDEYHMVVHPVVLGAGTPFFPPGVSRFDLRLTAPSPPAPCTWATRLSDDRRREPRMGDGISAITLLVEDVPAAKFYSAAFGLPVEAATSRTMRRSGVAVLSLTAMASGRELARPPTHA